jgi:hypothetical protein
MQTEIGTWRRPGTWLSDGAIDHYLSTGFHTLSVPQVARAGIQSPGIPIVVFLESSGHIFAPPQAIQGALGQQGRIWISETVRNRNPHLGPERAGILIRQLMPSNPEMIVMPIQLDSMSHQSAIIVSRQGGNWQATFFDPMGSRNSESPEWRQYRESVVNALGNRNVAVRISQVALQTDVSSCVPITADFLAKVIANPDLRNAPDFPESITRQIQRQFPVAEQYANHARQKVVDVYENPEKFRGALATEAKLQASEPRIRFGVSEPKIRFGIDALPEPTLTSQMKANIFKGGLPGLAGAGAAAYLELDKGVAAGISAFQEAIMPGSTTSGKDVCKFTGTVVGNVTGAVVAAPVSAAAFVGGTAASVPLLGLAAPAGGGVAAFVAGGATFSVTQPATSKLTEAACNAMLSDKVKQVADSMLGKLDAVLSFDTISPPQKQARQQVADAGKAGNPR